VAGKKYERPYNYNQSEKATFIDWIRNASFLSNESILIIYVISNTKNFSPHGTTAPSGPGPPHYQGFTQTHHNR
jgi:hypothetical protein